MTDAAPGDAFLTLPSGPRPADEPAPTDDLMTYYNLRRLYDFTQSGMAPVDYLAGAPTDARPTRGAADGGLAPLARGPPPGVGVGGGGAPRPPLAAASLRDGVALAPGRWRGLTDAERGGEGGGEKQG